MSDAQRLQAAEACLEILDTAFFRALCEPSRLEVVVALVKVGRADITEIAKQTPLDRSVVSRHLQTLEQAGLAVSQKEGRQTFYELDGPAIMEKFKTAMTAIEPLVPICCPANSR
ncbi:MAG: metalloregulator ArsR/SmtB family transcription factor [Pseudomonadota bacterium]